MSTKTPPADGSRDFSLVLGGPLYQLLLKTRLARPPLDLLERRVAVITLVAWLPLLVLSLLAGQALGGVTIPFLKDVDAHVRLLVALPLLVLAEKIVHERLRPAVTLFVEKGIVRPDDRSRFDGIVASTLRWRNSVAVELVLLALVLTVGHTLWADKLAVHGATWFARPADSGPELTHAGLWYAWVSLPIFQFILIRWWFRLVLWARFLWLVSRLDLDLSPAHPDRAGGLGFLGTSTAAFAPILVAQSALVSAMAAGRILNEGAQLQAFKVELVGMLGFALLQTLGPLSCSARLSPVPSDAACASTGFSETATSGSSTANGSAAARRAANRSSAPPTSSPSPISAGASTSSGACGPSPSGRRPSFSSPSRRPFPRSSSCTTRTAAETSRSRWRGSRAPRRTRASSRAGRTSSRCPA